MIKYEYKKEERWFYNDDNKKEEEKYLNEMGDNGWELVGTISQAHSSYIKYYWKRIKTVKNLD